MISKEKGPKFINLNVNVQKNVHIEEEKIHDITLRNQ